MPSVEIDYSNPFGDGSRPYLVMHVTGINGASGDIIGLLDTGADTTALPAGYAPLMGYQAPELERVEVGTAQGLAHAWRAKTPSTATVGGATPPTLTLDIRPTFVDSATALWGRGDVMRLFALTIEDSRQKYALSW